MIARCNQSGWLIEGQGQPHGNFEMLAACAPPYRGLMHLWHDQALPFTSLEAWNEGDRIRSSRFLGPLHGAACILSSYGNLEVVAARTDGSLAHFWRQGIFGWHGPYFLPGTAGGPPALIQSRYGALGNFEVIVPRQGGGLSHFWRDNDGAADWREAKCQPSATGQWTGLGFIHSSNGVLEIMGVADNKLVYLQQRPNRDWAPPEVITKGCQGRPGFIQSAAVPQTNFMSVAALREGGLVCFDRNARTGFHWHNAGCFGAGRRGELFQFDDVTMIQSSFGRTEVVARYISQRGPHDRVDSGVPAGPRLGLKHYRRACHQWEGPNDLPFFDCDP